MLKEEEEEEEEKKKEIRKSESKYRRMRKNAKMFLSSPFGGENLDTPLRKCPQLSVLSTNVLYSFIIVLFSF